MTKGQLLEEESRKNKKMSEEAARILLDLQSKSPTEQSRGLLEQLEAEKEKHDSMLKDLSELKKMYTKCKEAKKAQAAAFKREISEYKFEVFLFTKFKYSWKN